MPIKSLESYLFERKLAHTSSIEILQNATIGIDVEHYLSRIYTFKKEQFLAGIGGIPSSLKDYIHSDLQVFKEFNIKPLFVILGLSIQVQTSKLQTNELTPQEYHLENTWTKLNNKQSHSYNSIESFRLFTDPLPLRPMINDLIKYFIEIGIDYLVAPYDASFQLSYLYQKNIIDSIYGSTDLLLTKIDKFILGMEFQSKDFRYVDKQKVITELNITERQFLDLSIMVGCNIQPVTFPNFPPLPKPNPVQPYPQLSYFKLGLDIIYQYNSFNGNNSDDLYGYIVGLNDPKLLELYFKGHSVIKYLPVLNVEGYVELYGVEMTKLGFDISTEEEEDDEEKESETPSVESKKSTLKVPNDVHELISQRLPPELYFYQSIGLLPLGLLEAITKGHLDIRPALESGLSDSYKKLITQKSFTDILDYQCNLLTQLLARYYQVKKIAVKYWFKDAVTEVNNRLIPPIFKRIEGLYLKSDEPSEVFTLAKFFKDVPVENKYDTSVEIKSRLEIVSAAYLRSLYLFGVVDNKTLKLNSVGQIFKKFVESDEGKSSETELEQLFLVLFFIHTKTLRLTESNREFSNVPKFFKELTSETGSTVDLSSQENKHVTIISRLFSLHKLNISPINYQGPISRNLLNFRSHIKFISRSLIDTIQAVLVDFIAHQHKNSVKDEYQTKSDWYKLIDQLPFYRDINNTLLGVVAEIYFEFAWRLSKQGKSKEETVKTAKDHLLNHVYQINNSSFNINVNGFNSITAEQLLGNLDDGVRFWKKFVRLAEISNELDKSLVSDDYLADIVGADEWLASLYST